MIPPDRTVMRRNEKGEPAFRSIIPRGATSPFDDDEPGRICGVAGCDGRCSDPPPDGETRGAV